MTGQFEGLLCHMDVADITNLTGAWDLHIKLNIPTQITGRQAFGSRSKILDSFFVPSPFFSSFCGVRGRGKRSWTKSSGIGCACLNKPILDYLNQAQTHGMSSISKQPSSNPLNADSTYYTQQFELKSTAVTRPQRQQGTAMLADRRWQVTEWGLLRLLSEATITWCTVPSISTGIMKSALFTGCWNDTKSRF